MIERLFAAIVLAACLAGLLRMALRPRQQQRFDAALRRAWARCRRLGQRMAQRLRRRPAPPPDPARVAEEAIRRAREGHWEGNVFKPRSFRRTKPPQRGE